MEFGSDPMGNLLRVLPERKQSLFNMLGPTLSNAWVLSNQSNFKKYISKNKQLGQSFINLTHTCLIILLLFFTIYMCMNIREKFCCKNQSPPLPYMYHMFYDSKSQLDHWHH